MKKIQVILLVLFSAYAVSGQVRKSENAKVFADTSQGKKVDSVTTKSPNNESIGFKPTVFKKLINQQFSLLLTGKTNNGIGNYADLDIADGQVSFQGSLINKSGSVWSVKASGGIDEGLLNVFDHSKLNSNISLGIQYDFLDLQNKVLIYEDRSFRKYKASEKKANNVYREQSLVLEHNQQLLQWRLQCFEFGAEKVKLEAKLTSLKSKSGMDQVSLLKDSILKDSIIYAIDRIKYRLDTLDNTLLNYTSIFIADNDNANDRASKIDSLLAKVDIRGFKFGWFSIAYKITSADFKLFDEAASYDGQVNDKKFVTHEARFQYSHYKWSDLPNQSVFWDAGVGVSLADNLSKLKKLELTEVKQYGANADDRRSEKKYNVYYGDYKKDLLGLRLFADYYKFFMANNVLAIHVYPEYVMQRKVKPVLNTGFGILFAFKDNKKDKSVVNAELYYNFLDVFKTTDVDYRLFERNDIGIRFVFPLTFKSYK